MHMQATLMNNQFYSDYMGIGYQPSPVVGDKAQFYILNLSTMTMEPFTCNKQEKDVYFACQDLHDNSDFRKHHALGGDMMAMLRQNEELILPKEFSEDLLLLRIGKTFVEKIGALTSPTPAPVPASIH